MQLAFDYMSDAKIVLQSGHVKFGVKSLRYSGEVTLRFEQLLDELPVIGGVVVYFLNPPTVDLNFTGIGKIAACAGLAGIIRSVVDSEISKMLVLPNQLAIPIAKQVDKSLLCAPKPIGLMRIHVTRASGLKGLDWRLFGKRTSDPYVYVKLAGETWKSSIIKKTCDPVWPDNEFGEFLVYDREQRLQITVYDSDMMDSDDLLGVVPTMMLGKALHVRRPVKLCATPQEAEREYASEDEDDDDSPSGASCGTLEFKCVMLRLCSGEFCGDRYVLKVKIDEIGLPQSFTDAIFMTVHVAGTAKSSRSGKDVASKRAQVDDTVQQIIRRMHEQCSLDVATIAVATNLKEEVVASVISGKAGECSRVVKIGSHLFFPMPPELVESGVLELVLESKRKKKVAKVASHSIRLAEIAAASDHKLKGPFQMVFEDFTSIADAQISLALLGTKEERTRHRSFARACTYLPLDDALDSKTPLLR